MKRRGLIIFSVASAVCVAAVILLALVYLNMSGDTPEVHLPAATDSLGGENNNRPGGADGKNVPELIELTPETVRYVIELIEKPKSYSGSYSVENFWQGGSSRTDVYVYVKDNIFRVSQRSDSFEKECIFTESDYYIWYSTDDSYYHGVRSEELSGGDIDEAVQMSGSYKELLELDSSSVFKTEYLPYGEGYCVYVSAEEGSLGYRGDYYISLESGLLLKHEIYDGERMIYKMEIGELALSAPSDSHFVLPDGTVIA